jgi:hypothetical protein
MSSLPRRTFLALAVLASTTLAAESVPGVGARVARRAPGSSERSWKVILTPAPEDLALAQISFRHARQRLSERSLRASVSGPFGDDYMVLVAVTPSATPGVARALVLLVNRPSPLLDPASVRVRLTAREALGEEITSKLANPLTRSGSALAPALCDLARGQALSGSQLRTLGSRGTPLTGFDAASAVAQAYDAVCSLPYASAFRQAVQASVSGGSAPAPQPEPPSPGPPVPGPPHCIPCDPRPGYACPLGVSPSICVASAGRPARLANAGAH